MADLAENARRKAQGKTPATNLSIANSGDQSESQNPIKLVEAGD